MVTSRSGIARIGLEEDVGELLERKGALTLTTSEAHATGMIKARRTLT